MKIDLNTIPEDFVKRPVMIGGETCYFVFPPHIGVRWTKDNLIFRSSIWNSEGELISASFPKFFNMHEQPDLDYVPFSLTANGGCQILEKLDGSTLIVSQYKGSLIVRTRGTTDVFLFDNADEVEYLQEKYPEAFKFANPTAKHTRIFEWESIANRIVIKHDEVDMKLIGIIRHEDYSLLPQDELDIIAKSLEVPRPKWYQFNSFKEMEEIVKNFKGVEGVCIYCNRGQTIRKLKGEEYLVKHRLKNELCNYDRVVDFYFQQGCMPFTDTYQAVVDALDYETAEEVRGDISRLCDGMKEVNKIIDGFHTFLVKIKDLPSRKEQALAIGQAYGGVKNNRAGMLFTLLDGKELTTDQKKKLMYQVTKK